MSSSISEHDLHGYVDGLLPPERRAEVSAWLAEHPDEAERVDAYMRLNAELQQAYSMPQQPWDIPAPRPQPPRWMQAAAMVALTLLGAAGGWWVNESRHSDYEQNQAQTLAQVQQRTLQQEIEQNLVLPARVSHRVYTPEVLHPVEVRRDQQQHLVGWLSKRLGKPVNAPDLEAQGFMLMGGRLLPATDGPAAQFMYENDAGQRLTLYVRQAEDKKQETAFRRFSQDGLSSFYWVDAGLGYALTGDISPEQLMHSANRVYRQLNF